MTLSLPLLVLVFIISLGSSLLLTPLVIRISHKAGFITYPGGRRIHSVPTPYLGGIAIFLAFMISILAALLRSSGFREEFLLKFAGVSIAGIIIVMLGMWDDIKEIKPITKLVGQIGAASVLFISGFKVQVFTNPFTGPDAPLPWFMSAPVTIIWIVAVMNAMNLIDGLDGLAAGITAIVCGSLFFVSLHLKNYATMFLLVALAGACLGFLRYNFHPAKIFMGDTGSLFLGLILATAALTGSQHKSTAATALLVPISALAIPISDTLLAILRRSNRDRPIFAADKKHLHHRLLGMGLKQRQIVVALYFISLYLGVFAFLFVLIPERYALILLFLLALGCFMGVRLLGFLEQRIKLVHRVNARRERSDV